MLPPLHAGWTVRRKSNHFEAYREVAEEFAKLIGIDPWLINPYFEKCGKINFQEKQGEECLEGYVAEILDDIRAKYREYGIKQEPFVIVKADAGTYGMGIMTVKDPSEVRGLNRNQRNKMAVVKEGLEVHEVMVQEGVYTFETVDDAVAEPVVYMIDHYVVGGFYRVHTERGTDENLNAPGMQFRAARVRRALLRPQPRRSRLPAQPLLRLRRDRPARPARGGHRARADRSRIRRHSTFECRLKERLSISCRLSPSARTPETCAYGAGISISG